MLSERARYATPEEVERQARDWPEAFLECRLYGHEWRPARATHYKKLHYFYVVHSCHRCGTERHAEMSERGAIFSQWLSYADGYLTRGVGRIVGDGRDELRRAALTRTWGDRMTESRKIERPHSGVTRRELGVA